jgi:hypothetical protein
LNWGRILRGLRSGLPENNKQYIISFNRIIKHRTGKDDIFIFSPEKLRQPHQNIIKNANSRQRYAAMHSMLVENVLLIK